MSFDINKINTNEDSNEFVDINKINEENNSNNEIDYDPEEYMVEDAEEGEQMKFEDKVKNFNYEEYKKTNSNNEEENIKINNIKIEEKDEEKCDENLNIEFYETIDNLNFYDIKNYKNNEIEIILKNKGETFWPQNSYIKMDIKFDSEKKIESFYFNKILINQGMAVAPSQIIKTKIQLFKGDYNDGSEFGKITIPFRLVTYDDKPLSKRLIKQINISKENNNKEIDELNLDYDDNDTDGLTNLQTDFYELTIKLSELSEFEKDDIYKTITPEMFDIRGNKSGDNFSKGQMRGQKPYDPPLGWTGHGLRVLDCYDNGDNRWLGNKNTKGEWWVAYHGTSINYVVSILLNGLKSGKEQYYSNQLDINNNKI